MGRAKTTPRMHPNSFGCGEDGAFSKSKSRYEKMVSERRKFGMIMVLAVLFTLQALSLSVGCASVTPPEEDWSKTFGGTADDRARSVQQTADGGYILAGHTYSYGTGGCDVWLLKTDSSGNKQWNKTFGGSDDDMAMSVQQTADGSYILAGMTESYGAGGSDFWLVKTDSNGSKQWSKTFGGASADMPWAVQQTADSGYILVGYTYSYGAGLNDFWLVKTDSNGSKQWSKTFGGASADMPWAVQQTADSGYILAGGTESYGAGGSDFWLVKTDSNGNKQWSKTFGGTGFDVATSVQQTTDGGYILAGIRQDTGRGDLDFWLVKTNSNGNKQWSKTFGGTGEDMAASVQETDDSGYILVGYKKKY